MGCPDKHPHGWEPIKLKWWMILLAAIIITFFVIFMIFICVIECAQAMIYKKTILKERSKRKYFNKDLLSIMRISIKEKRKAVNAKNTAVESNY